jgi:hypothetical protein
MSRSFFLIIGILALGLGILGMALPVLPTTPFLLLAGAMFVRSSDRMATWLFDHKVFGPPVQNYLENKSVDKRSKIMALGLLWPAILISAILIDSVWLKALLILIGISVTVHILNLKTTYH